MISKDIDNISLSEELSNFFWIISSLLDESIISVNGWVLLWEKVTLINSFAILFFKFFVSTLFSCKIGSNFLAIILEYNSTKFLLFSFLSNSNEYLNFSSFFLIFIFFLIFFENLSSISFKVNIFSSSFSILLAFFGLLYFKVWLINVSKLLLSLSVSLILCIISL